MYFHGLDHFTSQPFIILMAEPTKFGEAQLLADNGGIRGIPEIIADGAPLSR